MFDIQIKHLHEELQQLLKSNSEMSLNNINQEVSSIRNNIISRINDMVISYGIKIDNDLIETIVDETLIGNLKSLNKTTLSKNYRTLYQFNDSIQNFIIQQAKEQKSKESKQEQIKLVMDKFDYTMQAYKETKINLLEQYNNLFQTILRKVPLYSSPELVENIKIFLTKEKESMEIYFQEQRNNIISSNLDKLISTQKYLTENTDLVSTVNLDNEKNIETSQVEIVETKSTETKENTNQKIKLSECDLNEGYYHFTNVKNIESILNNGLEARIGTASKMVNDRPNVSISQGGKGVFGIINSFIHVLSKKKINEIPEDFRKYFNDIKDFSSDEIISRDSVCNAIINKLKDEVYIYVNLDEELLSDARIGGLTGYDINLPNGIDSSRLGVITDDNGNILSSYDIISYMYDKVKNNNIWKEFNQDLFYMMEFNQISKENSVLNDSIVKKNNDETINMEKEDSVISIHKSSENDDVESIKQVQSTANNQQQISESYRMLDDGTIEYIGSHNEIAMDDEYRQMLSELDQPSAKVSNDQILIDTIKKNINDNLWNEIGIIALNTDNAIDILSNQTLQETQAVLEKYGIQNTSNLTRRIVDELNIELREINNNLSANMIKSFTKINEETVNSISQTFYKPDELKEQDVSQCMEVYKSSTSLSSFKLTCQKQFEQCMSKIRYEYKINKPSNIYNELFRVFENKRMQMESQFYNMYMIFSNGNSMFIEKAIGSTMLSQEMMREMQQDLSQQQIQAMIGYNYQEYEKNYYEMKAQRDLEQISGMSR